MHFKKRNNTLVVFVIYGLISLLIVGCSESLENVFLDQLKTRITKEGERCYSTRNILGLEYLETESTGKRYLSVRSGDKGGRGQEMVKRLQKAGYLSGATEKIKFNFSNWVGYELNDKGREHIIWDKGVCVGRRNVTGIIEYTEPADMLGMVLSRVKYKYDVSTNDIVHDLGVEEWVKEKLPGEGVAEFTKTNKGWRLSSLLH